MLDCTNQFSLMLLVPLCEGKQTIDRFYQGLRATGLKVDRVALRTHQRANTPATETRTPSRANSWVIVRGRTVPPHAEQAECKKSFIIVFFLFELD